MQSPAAHAFQFVALNPSDEGHVAAFTRLYVAAFASSDAAFFGGTIDPQKTDPAYWRMQFQRECCDAVLAMAPDGREAGFALWSEEGSANGYLDLIWLSDAHKGRGIGTSLARAAFEQMHDDRYQNVSLHVAPDNVRMERLLEKFGCAVRRQVAGFSTATGGLVQMLSCAGPRCTTP